MVYFHDLDCVLVQGFDNLPFQVGQRLEKHVNITSLLKGDQGLAVLVTLQQSRNAVSKSCQQLGTFSVSVPYDRHFFLLTDTEASNPPPKPNTELYLASATQIPFPKPGSYISRF